MFHKGSLSRSILVGFACISVGVGVIGKIAGPDKAAVATHTAVGVTSFGAGTTTGSSVEIVPGFMAGWHAADGASTGYLPSQTAASTKAADQAAIDKAVKDAIAKQKAADKKAADKKAADKKAAEKKITPKN